MTEMLLPIALKWAAETNPTELFKSVIMFIIAFTVVKKYLFGELGKHLTSVKDELVKLTGSVENLENALVKLEKNHNKRLESLHGRVENLEIIITKEKN